MQNNLILTYIHYLIHPFRTHDSFINEDEEIRQLSLGESISLSWIFVVLNGVVRIILINLVVVLYLHFLGGGEGFLNVFESEEGFIGFYFIILSTFLDIIFYPLFMLFFTQFWEFVLKVFGFLLGVEDTQKRAQDILTVAMSSQVLGIVPVFGAIAQKFASLVLIFAGVKKQMNTTTAMTVCILLFPALMSLGLFSVVVFLYILSLSS